MEQPACAALTMAFRDHFSSIASQYAAFRPTYPDALFDFIASLTTRRDLAWDCATGNGQAARGIAQRFAHVIATDASAKQIASAEPIDNVEYRVAPAEASGLAGASVDLVTVAQALHWLDLARFFAEVERVVRPGGALAVWGYGDARIEDDEDVDAIFRSFGRGTVGPYWPKGREVLDNKYQGFALPFAECVAPSLSLVQEWTLDQFLGYVRTWSAVQRFIEEHRDDPTVDFAERLRSVWSEPSGTRRVVWPVWMRASVRSS